MNRKENGTGSKIRTMPSGLFRIDVSLGYKIDGTRYRVAVYGKTHAEVENKADKLLTQYVQSETIVIKADELTELIERAVIKALSGFQLSFSQVLHAPAQLEIPLNKEPVRIMLPETPKTKPTKPESLTLSPDEFRQALGTRGYGINRIRELLREGRIKHVKSGSKNFRIPRSEIVDFIERETQGGS